uniref:Non-specific lipid-transfer protein-like n=1 Tax=Cicer arietinum TaxID=3827 RepID=A0A1S3EEH8_CICAR|nr:non-specific lipid-transfer protein-like [Cicer arietinum]
MARKNMVDLLVFVMVLALLRTSINASLIDGFICIKVKLSLYPCVTFLESSTSTKPPINCCEGANSLLQMASTTIDRRNVCKCLISTSTKSKVNSTRAKELPQLCSINISFPLNSDINCDSIP